MTDEAKARVEAAAPEMLAALQECMEVLNSPELKSWDSMALTWSMRFGGKGYTGKPFPREAMEKAIAKATTG